MKPTKSILDKSFRYVPSASTNIRKTFERIRNEMKREKAAATPCALPGTRQVIALRPREKG
jgi:hypothetical protein